MENTNYTEEGIKELLLDFNLDESVNDLRRYYSSPTTWDIIHQSRKETSHTKFLAWFFGNDDFNANPNTGPIKKLVVLLLKWARRQQGAQFDEDLESSIYAQDFSICSYKVKSEYPASTPKYKDGRMDIFINCEAMVGEEPRNINIVIENKINSPETTKPNDKNEKIYQTDAYYEYVTNKFKDNINLFVLLKPTICKLDNIKQAECNCKKYIQLNYQELLDNIIQPVSELKDITPEDSFRLKDYIKTLGKPSGVDEKDNNNNLITNNRITTMAMDNKQKKLLSNFFANNEDLIRAAIDALGDSELSEKMSKVKCKSVRRFYTINDEGNYSMNDVLVEFIKFRIDSGSSVNDIDKEIQSYISSSRTIVTDDSSVKLTEGRFKSFYYGDRIIRYTNQWSDGKSTDNFARFRNEVSKKYSSDFQISGISSNV